MTPTRLFDCIDYQLQQFPKEDMFAAKEDSIWRKYSKGSQRDCDKTCCRTYAYRNWRA